MLLPILASFLFSSTPKPLTDTLFVSNKKPKVVIAKTVEIPATVNKEVVLKLVNDVRKKGCQCGDTYFYPVPELTWNTQLEEAAYKHSNDMYRKNFFSHVAPDGSKAGLRIERTGYKWKAYGENIASGYASEKEVVRGWIKSPGHCKNIMNKGFKEMGVARAGDYWTQEFGAK